VVDPVLPIEPDVPVEAIELEAGELVALLDVELAPIVELDVLDPEPDPELPSFDCVASRCGARPSPPASPASPALGRPPLHATAPRTPTATRPALLNAFTVTIPS